MAEGWEQVSQLAHEGVNTGITRVAARDSEPQFFAEHDKLRFDQSSWRRAQCPPSIPGLRRVRIRVLSCRQVGWVAKGHFKSPSYVNSRCYQYNDSKAAGQQAGDFEARIPVHQTSYSPIYGLGKGSFNRMLGSLLSSGLHKLGCGTPSRDSGVLRLQKENEEGAVCKPGPGGPLWTFLWVSQS